MAAKTDTLWQGRLFILTLTHVVGTTGYMSVMAMAPVIRDDMAINATNFGFFMSAFFGAQMVAALPSGMITDRLGVGRTLTLSMALICLGTAGFVLSPGFTQAFLAMFLMGLGYSLVNPATARAVVDWFPRRRRGTAMGIKQLGVPLGGVLAAGAGVLVVILDWQTILWAVTAATLIAAVFSLRLAAHSDIVRRPQSLISELKHVLGNRTLGVISISVVTFNTGQSCLFAYLTLFIRDAALASQPIAGLCMALAQGASAGGRVGFSYLSDTLFLGARKPVAVGLLLASVVSLVAASLVDPGWPTWGLALLALFMGGTIASYAALILAATAEAVAPERVGS
ncbi:MAG: MFS transporter, partial [Methyloligellaceae bacterium]